MNNSLNPLIIKTNKINFAHEVIFRNALLVCKAMTHKPTCNSNKITGSWYVIALLNQKIYVDGSAIEQYCKARNNNPIHAKFFFTRLSFNTYLFNTVRRKKT